MPMKYPATRPVGPPAQTSSNGENSRQRSSPHKMLRAINCPAIAEVFKPWRPKPLATHNPRRNWPICGMPCTVSPTAPPQVSAISTGPSFGNTVRILRSMARPCSPCEHGQTVDIFAAVDLECLGIIHAVKIVIGPKLAAHAINLPAFHLGLKILA